MRNFILTVGLLATSNLCFAADAAKGKEIYLQRCSVCHGDTGLGDGAGSAAMPPEQKPRNFAEGKFKFATDEAKFKELLAKGGGAVGLSPMMPPSPDLKPDDMANIYAFVTSLKK